jgi:uncharacterized protein
MSGALQQGLSEAEIAVLAARLAANPHPEALSLGAVDGLFCALVASPATVMPHEYLPVILGGTQGEDGVPGRTWARGYMRGVHLARDGWSRILQDERENLVRYIPIVAGEVDPTWPKEPLTQEQSKAMLADILEGAGRAYRYFKQDRVAQAQAAALRSQPYERADPKIGRNDPCPCGSGKKYKRCCGAPRAEVRAVH